MIAINCPGRPIFVAVCVAQLRLFQTLSTSEGTSERGCVAPRGSDETSLLQTYLNTYHRASEYLEDDSDVRSASDTDSPPVVIWKPAPSPPPPDRETEIVDVHPDPAAPNAPPSPSTETVPIDAPTHAPSPPPVVYQPDHSSCTPQCTWKCESKKCDEVCAPVCKAPQCQTRCKGFNTKSCHMECVKPHCAVVCPKRICPRDNCPKCKTTCSKPSCKMRCNADEQPCRNVCAQPDCKWQCKAPRDCPKPNCKMVCELPKNCLGSTSKQLPAMDPGECEVKSFEAPENLHAMLAQAEPGKIATMRVPVSTMGEGFTTELSHIELPVRGSLMPGETMEDGILSEMPNLPLYPDNYHHTA